MRHLSYIVILTLPLIASGIGNNSNVILITLDGVRWQEFFNGSDSLLSKNISSEYYGHAFPLFWEKYSHQSAIYGHHKSGSPMSTNAVPVSLPGYKSIFLGHDHDCDDNSCGRVQSETFPERLIHELNLDKLQVAGFASWGKIDQALEQNVGTIFINTNISDADDGTVDPVMDSLNVLQKSDPPQGWGGARRDIYTWAHSMHYLKKHRPRFLYIGLDDSDEYAHMRQYENYLASLRQYDQWIDQLMRLLKTMGEYGENTTVFISTDHGRGKRKMWHGHANFSWNLHLYTGKHIWCVILGSKIQPLGIVKNVREKSHQSIRPTVEILFGLNPEYPGKAFFEALPSLR